MNTFLYFVWRRNPNEVETGKMTYQLTPVLITSSRQEAVEMCTNEEAEYVFSYQEVFWAV